jgi:hypothetical protein
MAMIAIAGFTEIFLQKRDWTRRGVREMSQNHQRRPAAVYKKSSHGDASSF